MVSSESFNKPSLVWKGSTLDNYPLQLTQSAVVKIIAQLPKQPGLKNFVKTNYKGNLKLAVARSIAQLAQNALYAGSISHPNFRSKLRVFKAEDAAGINYQILALPVSNTHSAIVDIRQAKNFDEAQMELSEDKKRELREEAQNALSTGMDSIQYISTVVAKTPNAGRGGSYKDTYKQQFRVESNHCPPQQAYQLSRRYRHLANAPNNLPAFPMLYYHHRSPKGRLGGASSTGGSGVHTDYARELANIMDTSGFAAAMYRDAKDMLNVTTPVRKFYLQAIIDAAQYAMSIGLMTRDDFVAFRDQITFDASHL